MRIWTLLLLLCPMAPLDAAEIRGNTMGSPYQVKWHGEAAAIDPEQLQHQVHQRLAQLNHTFSHFQPQSELSRFNRSAQGGEVSTALLEVVHRANTLHQHTEGTLDITVAPLVSLWGFGPDGAITTPPSAEAIAEARTKTGMEKLTLGPQRLEKSHPDLTLNLGAIAKGYAVDQLAELLEARGVPNYLINVGGEMRLKGRNPQGNLWRIGIEQPGSKGQQSMLTVAPGDAAVATSGDYRQYFRHQGKHYTHIIDPTLGAPIQSQVISATVIHPYCLEADGYATAAMVMGAERALAMAEHLGLAMMLIEVEDGQWQLHRSRAFKQLTSRDPPGL
ncbi:FAD:protein FMN transferase [Ferrimonas balearica]|uniref:FAD:protein FMN transferase n=1 Tax=Ferrimonas balearica TaxID=44012 RepID=UPI001C58BE70|nr:FAD:protein FMN transferase [Ferrimonas balearica]MBW3141192.1 FAD:protein FMN transferase [Ferrimonas balearica]